MATPLLVALVVIETSDLVFALDSIPAVFAVTRDPFLVYTSNVFALLGLRSLYFVLAGAIRELRFLRTGLGIMLLFVAAKMLLATWWRFRRWCPLPSSRHLRRRHPGVAAFPGATPGAAAEAPAPARTATRSATCGPRAQVRRVRAVGRPMGRPAHVPHLRQRRLLRQLEESARDAAFRGDRPSDRAVDRAGRELEVVLCRSRDGGLGVMFQ